MLQVRAAILRRPLVTRTAWNSPVGKKSSKHMIVAAAHRKKTPGLESNPTESDLQSFNSAFYYIKYRRDTSARLCWLQKSLYITSAVCFVASLWSKLKACWMMSSRRSSPSVCYIAAVHVKGNTSSIVPPLIPWLLDITVSHVCIINEVKPTGSWKHDRADRDASSWLS